MIVTKTWIETNYNKFNKLFWGGKLPVVEFRVGMARNYWGYAEYKINYSKNTIKPFRITISNYYDSPEYVKQQTLIHEMIHIADYYFHPEHFFKNGRRVSSRVYDAHGAWFQDEAKRIEECSSFKIGMRVTTEETKASRLSDVTKRKIENNNKNALICVVTGMNGVIFYFKTDVHKVETVKRNINRTYWTLIDKVKSIKFYTFDDPIYSQLRSCSSRFSGWHTDKKGLMAFLKKIKATTVVF